MDFFSKNCFQKKISSGSGKPLKSIQITLLSRPEQFNLELLAGISFSSHDPSQMSNGFLTLADGVVITFAKEIMNPIMGT